MWNDGGVAVLREPISTVMHNAGHIVQLSEIADAIGIVFVKVVFCSWSQMFEGNSNKVIALGSALHVVEAQSVEELVDDCSKSEAACFDGVRLKVDSLATVIEVSNIRVASTVVGLLRGKGQTRFGW